MVFFISFKQQRRLLELQEDIIQCPVQQRNVEQGGNSSKLN